MKTTIAVGPAAILGVANSRRRGRVVYGPDEIDSFFAIDGALTAYLIPYELVAGYTAIRLGRYRQYIVADRGALIADANAASVPAL